MSSHLIAFSNFKIYLKVKKVKNIRHSSLKFPNHIQIVLLVYHVRHEGETCFEQLLIKLRQSKDSAPNFFALVIGATSLESC